MDVRYALATFFNDRCFVYTLDRSKLVYGCSSVAKELFCAFCRPSINNMKAFLTLFIFALAASSAQENNKDDVEVLHENYDEDQESEDFRRYGYGGHGGYAGHGAYGGHGAAYGGHGHGYEDIIEPGVVRTRVTVQKRILRPVVRRRRPVVHAAPHYPGPVAAAGVDPGFEGSYVAVSGRPGAHTVHAVNGRGSVAIEPGRVPVVAHAIPVDGIGHGIAGGLPKCSYLDTDFFGNDVGDGRGLTTGSPYACKEACIDQDGCSFWTFRHGWARDCYLKRAADDDDDERPEGIEFKPGFVSGTVGNRCSCLRNDGDRICPTRRRGGVGFPWRRQGPRFDYDDDEDFYDDDDDDDGSREVATRRRNRNDNDKDDDDSGSSRR